MSSAATPAFLIVDGNNIIHAWSDLLALHRQRRGLAHVELCHRLRQFLDQSAFRVVVVFDGRGGQHSEERESGGLQVIYTSGGSSADVVIERLAARYAKKYRLAVATDDFAEQNLVTGFGAEVWSAQALRDAVERGLRGLARMAEVTAADHCRQPFSSVSSRLAIWRRPRVWSFSGRTMRQARAWFTSSMPESTADSMAPS
jgi:uncharacterized protein